MEGSLVTGPPAEISVRDALELPALRHGLPEVVAGADGLDRPIRWVHAGEVPNMAQLLRGGELLLTTGMGVGTRRAEQRRFVGELADRGIAALVVELGVRFPVLPDALVDAARGRGLPLVQLHRQVPFVAVTEAVHTAIVNGHYRLLRSAEEIARRFSEALLAGEGVPAVLRLLAGHTGNPVVVENAEGRVLAYAGGADHDRPEPSSSALAVWEAAARRACGPALRIPVPMGSPDRLGHLVVVPVDSALTPLHRIVADRAASLIALAMLRSRQEEELAAHGHSDFLDDLASGRIPADEAAGRARVLGFAARALLVPAVVRLPPDDGLVAGDPRPGGAPWRTAGRAIGAELAGLGLPVMVGSSPPAGRLLVLAGVPDRGRRTATADRIAAAAQAGAARAGLTGRPLVIVGQVQTWATAAAGLRHAAEVAVAAAGLAPRPWHDARTLDVELLLWLQREHGSLAGFVRRNLGPLLGPAHRQALGTLEAYCRHGGRKAEAARELQINRQTLYARLARIRRLLDVDLADHEAILTLSLALRARRHLPQEGGDPGLSTGDRSAGTGPARPQGWEA
ncbi:PucR family transcriptional regulator [Actinomadura macrotermitis]|uniref:Purine catabolism regulatory protein n=1 Tax=Actinomadura macrotermitis TaxID=2585200 RepID=A0A7K0C4N4_9ACTN|nr:PucR family transcriptional regulator [Actinomadura macrotermitis]MQY08395.1 Purine catabolism regulatory protein [Actinomadura macrotermitis]